MKVMKNIKKKFTKFTRMHKRNPNIISYILYYNNVEI